VRVIGPLRRRGVRSWVVRATQPLPPELVTEVSQRARAVMPDVLHLEGPRLAPLAAHVSVPRTVLSAHDALSLRYRDFARFARSRRGRLGWTLRAAVAARFERRWYPRCSAIAVTSPLDRQVLARAVPNDRLHVIPNGVDLEYYGYQPSPEPGRLVFTGNMGWPPNEDAAEHFAREMLPRIQARVPGATFWVVGADPSPRVRGLAALPGVSVTGGVPDIRPYVWSAAAYVSPLRFGAGVKNKILEAMALGAPIVATPRSLTGTPLVNGQDLLVAEAADDIVHAAATLLEDAGLGARLSREARRHVESGYAWPAIAARYEKLYRGSGEAAHGGSAARSPMGMTRS
jgi:glycosyltransferase involved in cell wall biosynthesis